MREGMLIPKVTLTREGDEVETDGGCAIGGQWINKTTDDYFKGKRVVLSVSRAFTIQLVVPTILVLKKSMRILKIWVLHHD